jgi:hypothetical protein
MAWHGLFVLLWRGHFCFHTGTIPKQLWIARKIFKNLFYRGDSERQPHRTTPNPTRSNAVFLLIRHAEPYRPHPATKPTTNRARARQQTYGKRFDGKTGKKYQPTAAHAGRAAQTQLVTLWLLFEHRFGKVGKSQKAHKSARCEIRRTGVLRGKMRLV